jgi:hypothetical protein
MLAALLAALVDKREVGAAVAGRWAMRSATLMRLASRHDHGRRRAQDVSSTGIAVG